MTQLPDQPPALLRLWWSIPNWSRLLPVLGGTLLAPMVLMPVSTPPASERAPDVAFAPVPPVEPVSPTSPLPPVGPVGPAGQVALAGQATPIAPNTRGSAGSAAQAAAPSPSATSATSLPETTSTTPASTIPSVGTTATSPLPEVVAPAAVPQARFNQPPAPSPQNGLSCPGSGKAGEYLAGSLGTCAVVHELSVDGTGA